MTGDAEVGRGLLKQNGKGVPPSGKGAPAVQAMMEQERRRVRLWEGLTIGLWVALGVEAFLGRGVGFIYSVFILPHRVAQGEGVSNTLAFILQVTSVVWPVVMCAAALCTVKFILASRQATLRQIQAELAEISEHIRALAGRER
ncbi:MAG: hypothetical protein NTU94_16480 [Planctomycetota bacterium]|nr:hypothetical protein [Planctomycetota bacterium]